MVDSSISAHGTRIYIGAPVTAGAHYSTLIEADVAGQSWVEIVRVDRAGMLGDVSPEVIFQPVDGRARRSGGEVDQGTFEFVCALIRDDPGQILFREAVGGQEDYFMRVSYSDDADEYFVVRPLSARRHAESATAPLRLVCRAALTSPVLEIAA